jgi:hypothetical protein
MVETINVKIDHYGNPVADERIILEWVIEN